MQGVAGDPVGQRRVARQGQLLARGDQDRRRQSTVGEERDHRRGVGAVAGVEDGRLLPRTADEPSHRVARVGAVGPPAEVRSWSGRRQRPDPVRGHDPGAVGGAPVPEVDGEVRAEVAGGGGEVAGRHHAVAAHGAGGDREAEPVPVSRGDGRVGHDVGLGHAEGVQDLVLQVVGVASPGRALHHQAGEDVVGVGVAPGRPGGRGQPRGAELGDRRTRGPLHGRGQDRAAGEVVEPAGLLQQVPDRDRPDRFAVGEPELGDVAGDRCVEGDLPGVDELHDRQCGERLGGRADDERRVGGDRVTVARTAGAPSGERAVGRGDHGGAAGDAGGVELLGEDRADGVGRRRSRRGPGRRQHRGAGDQRAGHQPGPAPASRGDGVHDLRSGVAGDG